MTHEVKGQTVTPLESPGLSSAQTHDARLIKLTSWTPSEAVPLGGAADSDTPVGLFWERVPGGGPGSGGSG